MTWGVPREQVTGRPPASLFLQGLLGADTSQSPSSAAPPSNDQSTQPGRCGPTWLSAHVDSWP